MEGDAKKVEDAEAKEPEKTKEESKEESKEDIGGDSAEAKEGEDMKAQVIVFIFLCLLTIFPCE